MHAGSHKHQGSSRPAPALGSQSGAQSCARSRTGPWLTASRPARPRCTPPPGAPWSGESAQRNSVTRTRLALTASCVKHAALCAHGRRAAAASGGHAQSSQVRLRWAWVARAHLQGVICGQGERQTACEEHGEGVAVVVQEQAVVGQGAHAQTHLGSTLVRSSSMATTWQTPFNRRAGLRQSHGSSLCNLRAGRQNGANLGQVVQVLQGQVLAQPDAVRDVLAQQQAADQVVDVASLTCAASAPSPGHSLLMRGAGRASLCCACHVPASARSGGAAEPRHPAHQPWSAGYKHVLVGAGPARDVPACGRMANVLRPLSSRSLLSVYRLA